eukprot:171089-Pelagomonas_calceolata.AAC.5
MPSHDPRSTHVHTSASSTCMRSTSWPPPYAHLHSCKHPTQTLGRLRTHHGTSQGPRWPLPRCLPLACVPHPHARRGWSQWQTHWPRWRRLPQPQQR